MRAVRIQQADETSVGYVERLLERADLPTVDVSDHPERFYVARHADGRVGVGGLETYGSVALLRSVAVERSVRGEGYGTALCDALERRAREAGVERMYLLTTTAREFFENRGYEAIDRDAVPNAIQETTEFADVCPSTAAVMEKSL